VVIVADKEGIVREQPGNKKNALADKEGELLSLVVFSLI
jgi:hypothetical protein